MRMQSVVYKLLCTSCCVQAVVYNPSCTICARKATQDALGTGAESKPDPAVEEAMSVVPTGERDAHRQTWELWLHALREELLQLQRSGISYLNVASRADLAPPALPVPAPLVPAGPRTKAPNTVTPNTAVPNTGRPSAERVRSKVPREIWETLSEASSPQPANRRSLAASSAVPFAVTSTASSTVFSAGPDRLTEAPAPAPQTAAQTAAAAPTAAPPVHSPSMSLRQSVQAEWIHPQVASAAASLQDLHAAYAQCRNCELAAGRQNLVFGEGSQQPALMFIGEGPGADEDEQGRPFVGRAGRILEGFITALGLVREDVYITNAVKCRPPGNRNPTPKEVLACMPILQRQIELLNPKLIVSLGNSAMKLLNPQANGIRRERGRIFPYLRWQVLPTYHPAYLLRNWNAFPECWADLRQAAQIAYAQFR